MPAHLFALSNGALVADQHRRRAPHAALAARRPALLLPRHARGRRLRDDRDQVARRARRLLRRARPRGRRPSARSRARREMLELFSRAVRRALPVPRYAQVFVADFIFGGMENTSATTLTDTVLLDERAALDYDVDALVAHELAHQWFGDLVTCRDWGEGWLNEGFATYFEYLWREHHEGRDAADLELEEWAEMYFGEDAGPLPPPDRDQALRRADRHLRPPPLREGRPRPPHAAPPARRRRVLRRRSRHYLDKHRHGVVETRDLARAVEEATGKNLDWFFSQWVIDGAGHPELEVGDPAGTPRRSSRRSPSSRRRRSTRGPRCSGCRPRCGSGSATRMPDVDVPLEIVEAAARVPPPARRRADAGDLRSRTRAARARQDRQARAGVDRRARRARRSRSTAAAAAQALARRGGPAAERALGEALRRRIRSGPCAARRRSGSRRSARRRRAIG